MSDGNPFTPTFGVTPPLLVGRAEEQAAFADGLVGGLGSPGRAMLLTGPRGSGKTVMLNALEDDARDRGWVVASETTHIGLATHLATSVLPRLMTKIDPDASSRRLTGGSVSAMGFGAGATTELVDHYPTTPRLRAGLEDLTDLLRATGRPGLLLSVDEIHACTRRPARGGAGGAARIPRGTRRGAAHGWASRCRAGCSER